MDCREFNLVTKEGLSLFGRAWIPPGEVRAVIGLVHGLGEHSGRYEGFAGHLGAGGFACVALDLRGFGRSEGGRGNVSSYDDLLDDIGLVLREVEKLFPGHKYFLYGHSMGGALVLNYALRRRPEAAGVIASGPWLRLVREPGIFATAVAAVLNVLRPGTSFSNGIDPVLLCRDGEVVRRFVADPLVHGRISASLFTACRRAGRWALAHAGEFPGPLALMHGGADRITSAAASREFAAKVQGECTFRLWEGYYHELHNEPQNEAFYDFLLHWLEGCLSR